MMYYNMDARQLKSELKEHVLEIIFEKLNGEIRVLKCTLRPQFLPEGYQHINSPEPADPETNAVPDNKTLVVWDVEHNGWRSFRVDRILSMPQMCASWY